MRLRFDAKLPAPENEGSLADFLDRILPLPDAGSVLKGLWKRSQLDLRFRSSSAAKLLFVAIRSRL